MKGTLCRDEQWTPISKIFQYVKFEWRKKQYNTSVMYSCASEVWENAEY